MAPKKGKQKVEETADTPPSSPILDVLPDPIFTFDVEDTDKFAENYEKCVEEIIKMMDDDTDVKYTFIVNEKQVHIPVTPGINDTADGMYVIKFVGGEMSLYLVATKHMAWFRGIVTNTGERYEIVNHRSPKILKRSESLGTNGMYTDLHRGQNIANVKLRKHRLVWAFYILAKLGKGERKADEKLALTIITLMFFEGPRFVDVYELVKKAFKGEDIEPGADNQHQVANWCDGSTDFYTEKGDDMKVHITISNTTSQVVRKIAKKFRIMCRTMWDTWNSEEASSSGSKK